MSGMIIGSRRSIPWWRRPRRVRRWRGWGEVPRTAWTSRRRREAGGRARIAGGCSRQLQRARGQMPRAFCYVSGLRAGLGSNSDAGWGRATKGHTPMRVRELEIRNYKSLRHVRLRPEDFGVLVGANAAGKSNLTDCLEFISEVYRHGLELAVARRGGVREHCPEEATPFEASGWHTGRCGVRLDCASP